MKVLVMPLTVLLFSQLGCILPAAKSESAATQSAKTEQTKDPEKMVVEMREGGDMQAQPHSWRIRIYADGLIQQPNVEKHVPALEVKRLMANLEKLGFFTTKSDELVKQLKAAGELKQILEGGHGVVTLIAYRKGKPHEVRFSHLDAYAGTSVRSVVQFRKAVEAVKKFAEDRP